jgi:hypothetical protein
MLHVANLEEIQSMLLRVPGLIDSLERRDPKFVDGVNEWLTKMEQVLLTNRLTVAAEIAGHRGALIAAKRGVNPSGLVFSGRVTARTLKDASAIDALRKAEELISNAIKGDAAQFAEAERLTRRIVTVAQHKGLIPAAPSTGGRTEMLNTIWHAISLDTDLAAAAVHLAGLVGAQDALVLLDRMLPMPV